MVQGLQFHSGFNYSQAIISVRPYLVNLRHVVKKFKDSSSGLRFNHANITFENTTTSQKFCG